MANDDKPKGPVEDSGGTDGVIDVADDKLSLIPLELVDRADAVAGAVEEVVVGDVDDVGEIPLKDRLPVLPEDSNAKQFGQTQCAILAMKWPDSSFDSLFFDCAGFEDGKFERFGDTVRFIFRDERPEARAVLTLKTLNEIGVPGIFDAVTVFWNGTLRTFAKGKSITWDSHDSSFAKMLETLSGKFAVARSFASEHFIERVREDRNADRAAVACEKFSDTDTFSISSIERLYGRPVLSGPEGIYGREEELSRIKEIFSPEAVANGTARLTLVAMSGIGKTKFIEHALKELAETYKDKNPSTLYVSAHATKKAEANSFLIGFGGLIQQLLELALKKDPEAEKMPVYSKLKGLIDGETDLLKDPARFQDDIRILMEKIAESGPLFIAFDDQQWVDPTSAATIRSIFLDRPIPNVALIGATRKAENESPPKTLLDVFKGASNIALDKLDMLDSHRYPTPVLKGFVRDMLKITDPDADLPLTFYRFLADKSGGKALTLVEQVKYMLNKRILVKGSVLLKNGRDDKGVSCGFREIGVPDGDVALIESQINRLTPDTKRALAILAVLGPSSLGLVSVVFKSSQDTAALMKLEYENIIQTSPFVDFAHPMTREVAIKLLNEFVPSCAESLIKVFEKLIERGQFHNECTALRLYKLAELAQDDDLKLKYGLAAGEEALNRYDNDLAIKIFEFIAGREKGFISDDQRFRSLRGLGRAKSQKGDYANAGQHLCEANRYVDSNDFGPALEFSALTRDVLYSSRDIMMLEGECKEARRLLESKASVMDRDQYNFESTRIEFDLARAAYAKAMFPGKYSDSFTFNQVRAMFLKLKNKILVDPACDYPDSRMIKEARRFIGLAHHYNHREVDSDVMALAMHEVDDASENYSEAVKHLTAFVEGWMENPAGINPKSVISALTIGGYSKMLLGQKDWPVLFKEASDTAIKYGDFAQAAYAFMMWGGSEVIQFYKTGCVDNDLLKSAFEHFNFAEREANLLENPPYKIELACDRVQAHYFAGLKGNRGVEFQKALDIIRTLDLNSMSNHPFSGNLQTLVALMKQADPAIAIPKNLVSADCLDDAVRYNHDQMMPLSDVASVTGEKLQALLYMLSEQDVEFLSAMRDSVHTKYMEGGFMEGGNKFDVNLHRRHIVPFLSWLSRLVAEKKGVKRIDLPSISVTDVRLGIDEIGAIARNLNRGDAKTASLRSALNAELAAMRSFVV